MAIVVGDGCNLGGGGQGRSTGEDSEEGREKDGSR